jgi:hypothetical protein
MKRILYILLLLVFSILAACTKHTIDLESPTPDSSRSYIFFEPRIINTRETKASIIPDDELPSTEGTAFGVIGYYGTNSLFGVQTADNKGIAEVRRSSAGVFEYAPLVPWQGTDSHIFYAFYPYSLNGTVNHNVVNDAAKPYLSYTQPKTNNADMIDILTAKTSITKASAAGVDVPIVFKHRLWALEIKIVNSQTSGLSASGTVENNAVPLTITGVILKVKGHPAGAKLYLDPDSTIDLNKDANNQVLCLGECTYELPLANENGDVIAAPIVTEAKTTTSSKTYGYLLFTPGGSFEYKVEISYKDAANNTYEFETDYVKSTTQFAAGNKYTLVINETPDTFVVGNYHDPDDDEEDDDDDFEAGDWKDVSVQHTFN